VSTLRHYLQALWREGLLLTVSSRHAPGATLADARRVIAGWPVANLGFALALTDGGEERPSARQLPLAKPSARTHTAEPERVA